MAPWNRSRLKERVSGAAWKKNEEPEKTAFIWPLGTEAAWKKEYPELEKNRIYLAPWNRSRLKEGVSGAAWKKEYPEPLERKNEEPEPEKKPHLFGPLEPKPLEKKTRVRFSLG